MSTTDLERGVINLNAHVQREIDELKQKIVDRVVRLEEEARALRARLDAHGTHDLDVRRIAQYARDIEDASAWLVDRDGLLERVDALARKTRRSAS